MQELTYETAMQQLEQITNRLETESLPLNDSLRLYEQASSLVRFCNDCLDQAEQKIVTLADVEAEHGNESDL